MSMKQLFKRISRLERGAARCERIAGERFSQATISSEFQGDLIDNGLAYKLAADQLRLQAAKLLLNVPIVVTC